MQLIAVFIMQRLAVLLESLEVLKEGDGNLLDRCIILPGQRERCTPDTHACNGHARERVWASRWTHLDHHFGSARLEPFSRFVLIERHGRDLS